MILYRHSGPRSFSDCVLNTVMHKMCHDVSKKTPNVSNNRSVNRPSLFHTETDLCNLSFDKGNKTNLQDFCLNWNLPYKNLTNTTKDMELILLHNYVCQGVCRHRAISSAMTQQPNSWACWLQVFNSDHNIPVTTSCLSPWPNSLMKTSWSCTMTQQPNDDFMIFHHDPTAQQRLHFFSTVTCRICNEALTESSPWKAE